ncbi:DUF1850 domain-containing protein [Halanaeroarchaeum sulfurireducens]|uniref:DUF1850 domain-containing protein n=1 Tax=Halanaeroarchaeum sulfurireducens TaxID=1604004 RepID=UPI0006791D4F|nr:DUF1850 domain-containing protein [Halanaeroarchaeum sulfurireducens]
MTRTRPSRTVLVAVLFGLVVATALAGAAHATGSPVLVVSDADTGEELFSTPVENGTTVTLEYMHSVEKTTVRDVYVVDDGSLRMTRMEFSSFGWGLPAREAIDGRTDDGAYLITFDTRTYEELSVVPGTVAGHTLAVGDTEYDLVDRSNATAVRISIEDRRALGTLSEYT